MVQYITVLYIFGTMDWCFVSLFKFKTPKPYSVLQTIYIKPCWQNGHNHPDNKIKLSFNISISSFHEKYENIIKIWQSFYPLVNKDWNLNHFSISSGEPLVLGSCQAKTIDVFFGFLCFIWKLRKIWKKSSSVVERGR